MVIVKSGRRICGTGACLANAPLHQNKSYFEFKIQSTGKCHHDVVTKQQGQKLIMASDNKVFDYLLNTFHNVPL